MNLRILIILYLISISTISICQNDPELNKTDHQGRKQGHWIKEYPDEMLMYDGFFRDDHPVGEFKRYYENGKLKSLLVYSDDGSSVSAAIYHPNGSIASKGNFINQMKEGQWQFFSSSDSGYLISEEYYSKNLRNGPSLKYYPDRTIAERVIYINDLREGQWIQYYPNGSICLKSNYMNGKVDGKFEVWYENGKTEFSGQYKNDARDGLWYIYDIDGNVKYKLEYREGITNDRQINIDESDYLDSLERNKGKIANPENTDIIW